MRLPCNRDLLLKLDSYHLHAAILERRVTIRNHRDTRGDDRCHLDDYLVWEMLDDSPAIPISPPPFEEAMALCRQFFYLRRAHAPDPMPFDVINDPKQWDNDLVPMTYYQLLVELICIQKVIRTHRDIGNRPRTIDDDRMLYSVLPEKIPADFRLPSEDEFLGEAKTPHAGCPAFWRSHDAYPHSRHDLHH